MNSILITGCNRGIGLGLVKKLLNQPNPPKHLITTCRDVTKAEVSEFKIPDLFISAAGLFFLMFEEFLTYLQQEP